MRIAWSQKLAAILFALGLCLSGVALGADSPEEVFWQSVRKTDLVEEYRLYIQQFPQGKHIGEAWRRIGQLEAATEAKQLQTDKASGKKERVERRPVAKGGKKAEARPVPPAAAKIDPFPPGRVFKDCSDCPDMVVIPAGNFEMGSSNGARDEMPVHRVDVDSFSLTRTEVTQGQWRAIMGTNPSYFSSCGDDCPVEQVSWNDAQEFVRRLSKKTGKSYRLPSEAEWEYAARAGTTTRYSFGDSESSLGDYAWYSANSGNQTRAVAGKRPNAFGLYDMHGNVWEWVEDCWNSSYNGAPRDGSAWTSGDCSQRVVRGGSSWGASNLRSAYRLTFPRDSRTWSVGFRLARTLL